MRLLALGLCLVLLGGDNVRRLLLAGGGGGSFTPPPVDVTVTVDSTSTIGSGGTLDWWGRASVVRRPDGVLVLGYQRSTGHAVNDGDGIHLRMSDDNGATWTAEDQHLTGAITGAPLQPSDATASQDAGEPWLIYAPSGDLLCFTWRVDYNSDNDGTYIFRSTDDGATWDAGSGPVDWGGLTGAQDLLTYATDDGFVIGSTIYIAGRVYADGSDYDPSAVVMMSSTDDGLTWTRDATLISAAGPPTGGAIEWGFERIGTSTFLGMIRDTAHTHSYRMTSDDLGVTWSAAEDVTSTVGIAGRQRVYTRAHLKGEASWWTDTVVLMVGFIQTAPPSSQGRRNAVWVSRDSGVTWTTPFYIDSDTEDAGYGDIFYDAGSDQYVVVSYQGTLAAASLKQYRLSITGI